MQRQLKSWVGGLVLLGVCAMPLAGAAQVSEEMAKAQTWINQNLDAGDAFTLCYTYKLTILLTQMVADSDTDSATDIEAENDKITLQCVKCAQDGGASCD